MALLAFANLAGMLLGSTGLSGALSDSEMLSAVGPWLPQIGSSRIAFISDGKVTTYNAPKFGPDFFPFGSLTKSATAALVLKLVELGKLDLGDKLSKYGFNVEAEDRITIQQMLCHTSGLPEYFWNVDAASKPTSGQIMDMIRKSAKSHPPEQGKFLYSNANYYLLGAICEKATGKTLDDLYHKYLFEPLGVLAKTGRTDHFDPNWYGGAGGLMGSITDLVTWAGAIARKDSRILEESSWNQLLTPHIPMNGKADSNQQYGYGVILAPLSIYDSASHAGAIPQNVSPPFVSLMVARPDNDNPIGFAAYTRAMWTKTSLNAIYGAYASATGLSDAKVWMERFRRSPKPDQLLRWVSGGHIAPGLAKLMDTQTCAELGSLLSGNFTLTVAGEQVQEMSVTLAIQVQTGQKSTVISVRFGPHGRLDTLGFRASTG